MKGVRVTGDCALISKRGNYGHALKCYELAKAYVIKHGLTAAIRVKQGTD